MDSIKSTLKLTREAIKNKDYAGALKLSKCVLKEDKVNYMALVFLGISLQEVGPIEQAAKAFHKAIQINSENVVAWNGLANYHEKINSIDSNDELFKIYMKLLELESNEIKIMEICKKLIDLSGNNISTVLNSIHNVFKNQKPDLKNQLSQLVINYVLRNAVPDDCIHVYKDMLAFLKTNPEFITETAYTEYLKILHKENEFEQLLIEAEKMHDLYRSNISALEWICKIYNEFKIEGNIAAVNMDEKIKNYCTKLLDLQKESINGFFTQALLLYDDEKYLESKDILKKVLALKPDLLHAWILITKCLIALHFYVESVESALKVEKLKETRNSIVLHRIIDALICNSLSKSTDRTHWKQSVELCEEFLNADAHDVQIISFLIQSHINLESNVDAKLWLSKLREIPDTQQLHSFLYVKLLQKQRKFSMALDVLENNVYETYDYWLILGEIYWDLGMQEKSLVPFLKAAKLDPNSYICFMHLGNYYQKFGDMDKARRCYEKCFKINQKCAMVGVELSKIYRKQKNWDTNLNLLLSLTGYKIDSTNLWAYLQLGLHYLEQEDYQNAINNLRIVIRADPDNSQCWESLADAYLARGAYTAALKSFQRASELTPDSLYPMLQIANINKLLGEYSGAKLEFENVLRINETYVLALKGIAETCMHQARHYHRQQLHGLARDSAQYALEKISISIKERSDVSCLWKLAADSCYFVANLPERFCCMLVTAALAEAKDENRNVILEREELYKLAARCYCKSINLTSDNVLIYHDLSSCYLSHATSNISDKETKIDLLLRALASVQHCIKQNPTYWQHWNLLGNIAFAKEPKKLALAQHAFIKAVSIERRSAIAWCNLASLYLYMGDVKLANEAYSQAQRADPNYTNSWVGQAMIAEAAGHEDAMDLFRHSTQLGAQNQGGVGYANWVCRTIIEAPSDKVIYSIHNMHAVPVALDALTWYTENNEEDACAWNMLGLLRERMGLKESALQAFRRALSLSDAAHRDLININYARSLQALGRHSKAVDVYRDVNEVTFKSGIGLALALFKDEQYQESYDSYESALHCLTDEEGSQSDVLVALASMAYLFQSSDSAKTLLLQSTQLEPRSPWGLYATLSLGLLNDDVNLAKLVLKEMHSFQDSKCLPHYAILSTYTYLLQGENTKAIRELSKLVHRRPDQGSLWLTLSILLLRLNGERPVTSAAGKCAQNAMRLGRNNMDVTKVFCIVSLASLLIGDFEAALKSAQKSIHCYPDVAEGWAILLTVMAAMQHPSRTQISAKISLILDHLKTTHEVREWLITYL